MYCPAFQISIFDWFAVLWLEEVLMVEILSYGCTNVRRCFRRKWPWLKCASKFTFDYLLLSFKTEGILPLSSCPLCDAAAYIETFFFLLSAWHSQSLEAKLQMKCCYLLKGYVHKQQFCCPWTRYELKVVSTGIEWVMIFPEKIS